MAQTGSEPRIFRSLEADALNTKQKRRYEVIEEGEEEVVEEGEREVEEGEEEAEVAEVENEEEVGGCKGE